MTISIDSALGIHADALRLREQRTEILAANLANADTPGFKARDLDFGSVLAGQGGGVSLDATDPGHITPGDTGMPAAVDLLYRLPTQSSLDGNTVDPHLENLENRRGEALIRCASRAGKEGPPFSRDLSPGKWSIPRLARLAGATLGSDCSQPIPAFGSAVPVVSRQASAMDQRLLDPSRLLGADATFA